MKNEFNINKTYSFNVWICFFPCTFLSIDSYFLIYSYKLSKNNISMKSIWYINAKLPNILKVSNHPVITKSSYSSTCVRNFPLCIFMHVATSLKIHSRFMLHNKIALSLMLFHLKIKKKKTRVSEWSLNIIIIIIIISLLFIFSSSILLLLWSADCAYNFVLI